MLGFNGGLIGRKRKQDPTTPGLWFPNERAIIAGSDPYWENVALLLHMNGSNGSTIFTDSSTNALTVSRFGDAQISTAESKFGGGSGYFDGNGDYLTIPGSAIFGISGDQQFCIELWFYRAATAFQNLIGYNNVSTTYWDLGIGNDGTSSNKIVFRYGGNNAKLVGASTVTSNSWNHLAVTRDLSTIRIFLNGVQDASVSDSVQSVPHTGSLGICRNLFGSGFDYYFTGYIDDLRITRGVARYQGSSFAVPTAPFPDY